MLIFILVVTISTAMATSQKKMCVLFLRMCQSSMNSKESILMKDHSPERVVES